MSMPRAVIFDFYGTLARWADSHLSNYTAVFATHGYVLPDETLVAYFARYDGVEHLEHSVSEEVYEAWVRHRLTDLITACAVVPAEHDLVMDALRASDQGPMVAYAEAVPTLRSLRDAGVAIGVCSNWGWELDGFLRQVALDDLIDVSVTSARAGARKPHPLIYARSAEALGVDAGGVVFVGDSWVPDVEGPRRAGMTPVHVWREDERAGQTPPDLEVGDHRIGDLRGLLEILDLME
jgi:putative hydrolase of the HAD superfamily